MNQDNLLNVLDFITTVDCSDEQKRTLLEMAANTITLDKLGQLVGTARETKEQDKSTLLKFTKKEILKVPEKYRMQVANLLIFPSPVNRERKFPAVGFLFVLAKFTSDIDGGKRLCQNIPSKEKTDSKIHSTKENANISLN